MHRASSNRRMKWKGSCFSSGYNDTSGCYPPHSCWISGFYGQDHYGGQENPLLRSSPAMALNPSRLLLSKPFLLSTPLLRLCPDLRSGMSIEDENCLLSDLERLSLLSNITISIPHWMILLNNVSTIANYSDNFKYGFDQERSSGYLTRLRVPRNMLIS